MDGNKNSNLPEISGPIEIIEPYEHRCSYCDTLLGEGDYGVSNGAEIWCSVRCYNRDQDGR